MSMTQRMWKTGGLLLMVFLGAADVIVRSAEPAHLRYSPPEKLCEVSHKPINESSGLAASRRYPGMFWTHNDSGDDPRLFAFDTAGRHLGTCKIKRADAVDWEDMASFSRGGRGYLVIGDVGDNGRSRSHAVIYIAPEPDDPTDNTRVVQTIEYTYEGGPIDCEALGVDITRREILLIEKRLGLHSRVYKLSLPLTALPQKKPRRDVAKLIAILRVPIVTAMDISPDGSRAIVMTLGNAFEFVRAPGEDWGEAFARPPRRVDLPPRRQGEAICYGPKGRDLYLTSEQRPMPLFRLTAQND